MNRQRLLLLSDLHYCQEEYGGISRDEKAQRLLDFIRAEHEKDPFEMILLLGDYSLDFWEWSTLGSWLTENVSYTKRFVDKYLSRLPAPYYMLPGNHEQYGESRWKEITGFSRSSGFVFGDWLFILWDSFGANLDPTDHSDGTYTPPDTNRILSLMDAHPGKKAVLCSHFFRPSFDPAEQALICDERVACLFQGHTHSASVITLPVEYGSKKLIQTGSWANVIPGGNSVWGMREVILETHRLTSRYIVPEQKLVFNGITYTVSARNENEAEIPV